MDVKPGVTKFLLKDNAGLYVCFYDKWSLSGLHIRKGDN